MVQNAQRVCGQPDGLSTAGAKITNIGKAKSPTSRTFRGISTGLSEVPRHAKEWGNLGHQGDARTGAVHNGDRRRTGRDRKFIRKWITTEGLPKRQKRETTTIADPFKPFTLEQMRKGVTNASKMLRLLHEGVAASLAGAEAHRLYRTMPKRMQSHVSRASGTSGQRVVRGTGC